MNARRSRASLDWRLAVRASRRQPPCGDPRRRHIAIIIVHGLGSQASGETLIEWARALSRSLSAWRRLAGLPTDPPVLSSHITFQPEDYPIVEFAVPGSSGRECHWLVTEALWAPFIREPSLSSVSSWLSGRGAVERLVDGVMGARSRTLLEQAERAERTYKHWSIVGTLAPRLFQSESPSEYTLRLADHMRAALPPDGLDWLERKLAELPDRGDAPADTHDEGILLRLDSPVGLKMVELGARWYHTTDRVIQFGLGTFLPTALRSFYVLRAGVVLSAMAGVVLLAYGSLRALLSVIPATSSAFGFVDGFLTRLIGDLQVLLTDPTQAANIRARVGAAIEGMAKLGSDRVVLVAHSGGAAVAYSTLTDDRFRSLRVDRLITLGQGLGAAWHILGMDAENARERASLESPLFAADLAEVRPHLEWSDYWSTHDPVPSGTPIAIPPWIRARPTNLTSPGIVNRQSTGEDHGGYWGNDEEFVIPVVESIRELDGGNSDLGKVWTNNARAVSRRDERVLTLAMWRRLSFLAIITVVLTTFPGRSANFVNGMGVWLAQAWSFIPFHGFLDALIAAIKASIQSVPVGVTRDIVDIGNVALILVIGGLVLSRTPPVGAWRPRLGAWHLFRWVIDIGVLVALVGLAWERMGPWLAANEASVLAYVVPVVLLGLLLSILAWLVDRAHWRSAKVALVAAVLIGAVCVVGSLVFALAVQDGIWTFVLGSALAYGLVQIVTGTGTWLWGRWDERERSAARMNAADPASGRRFAVAIGAILLAALVGVVVALVGGPETIGQATPWAPDILNIRNTPLVYLGPIAFALTLVACLLGVARETIDPWRD